MNKKLLLLLTVCFIAVQANARILRTNNTPGSSAEFSTLTAAYEAAVDGDTIYLEGSSTAYVAGNATFVINKSITLMGPGYWLQENGLVNYGATGASFSTLSRLEIRKSGVVLRGLTTNIINVYAANVVITRCRTGEIMLYETSNVCIHQNYINGSIVGSSGGYICSSNIQITNNVIYCTEIKKLNQSTVAYNHISVFNFSPTNYNNTFTNNMIHVRSTNPAALDETNSIDATNYLGEWTLQCLGGDSGFTTDKDYQLLSTSTLKTMGAGGGEIGAFGGNDPYVISGVPNVPLIRNLEVPASANEIDGLQVKVTITTER